MAAIATGSFVKVLVNGMRKHGQYRGAGSIEVLDGGVALTGKHVFSLGQRWLFAILISVGILILSVGTFAPGIILLYPLVEYVWLKRADQLVPFDRVEAYNAVPEKNLIAIQFKGTPWEAPAVMRSPEWRSVYDALWQHAPLARVSA
jgi:hypothetical protein